MTEGVHFLDARGPDGTRLYAIGDVHGCIDQLEATFAETLSAMGVHGNAPPRAMAS